MQDVVAHAVLSAAIAAMGGRNRLASVHSLEYTAVGDRAMVEQSERPTGPFFIDHFKIHVVRDLDGKREQIVTTDEAYAADHWWQDQKPQSSIIAINGDVSAAWYNVKWNYGGRNALQESQERQAFAPERLLLTADKSSDLRALRDVTLHGVRHHVLAFHWNGAPVSLYINADNNYPWQVSYTRPYPYQTFLNPWGDVPTTITYSAWSLEGNGMSYPREWTTTRLGLPDQQIFITSLTVNPQIDQADITISADVVKAHPRPVAIDDNPLGLGGSGAPHDLAPGVFQYPGAWNIEFVRQNDGVVVIEAPWSTGYTKRALQAARAKYGMRVKAVITTSDSWPHIAGVRQAVAENIPIYALDLNVPILTRLVTAPRAMRPDDLQLHPHRAHFVVVSKPTAVGTGSNRIVIYPYRTVTGERQMMVYFPEHRLLYTSDLFSQDSGPNDWFTPQYLREAVSAIDRYGLAPKTIFGTHYDPVPYEAILQR